MTKLTQIDALALAKTFKAGALAVGQFQIDHWDTLSKSQRQALADSEFALLDHSQNLITSAVGLRLDEVQTSLAAIQRATAARTAAMTIAITAPSTAAQNATLKPRANSTKAKTMRPALMLLSQLRLKPR